MSTDDGSIPAAWLAHSGVVVYALRPDDRRCEFVTPNVETLTGWPVAEALRPGWWLDGLHPDERDQVAALPLASDDGARLTTDFRFRHRDGSYIWLRDQRQLVSEPGRPERVVGTWTEISELIAIRDELTATTRRYRKLFDANPEPTWVYDVETLHFRIVNEAAVRRYGWSRDEFLALTVRDIRPPEDLARLEAALAAPDEGLRRAGQWRHRRKDGELLDVEITSHALQFDDRPARLVVAHDITSRKRAEADRDRLAAAIEQAAEAIVITDRDGSIQYVNPAFEAITGYSRAETLGRNPRLLNSGRQPRALYRELWETIGRGETWRGRLVNRAKDGRLFTEEAVISPIVGGDGEIEGFVAVKRDVTAELRLEADLRQAQKLDALGSLAGGVAHDFNNMLGVILGNAELALADAATPAPLRERLNEIVGAARRSAQLTRQLLGFARRQPVSPRAVDLNETVESLLKMMRRLIGENIELEWRPAPGLWPVWIDPSQVDQILANLCVNARDAIAGVGRVTITTSNRSVAAESGPGMATDPPGDVVRLSVADTGCGMEPALLDRIFEPFFTTKAVGEGTGLGLANVYGIVQQNRGRIAVESEPGRGTTFVIDLPRHLANVEDEPRAEPEAPRGGHGERVLLVEDDPSLLRALELMLRRFGYEPLTADGPAAALEIAADPRRQIDLLLTDVVMPGMSGYELAARFAELRPRGACLFMSGYAAGAAVPAALAGAPRHSIQKPFSGRDLAARIRELLAAD
jgi:two-component system cell cycle sensor histidine kinase/response regulator CckA